MLLPAFHRRWLNQIDWQDVESETKIRHGCDFYWLHTSGMLWIENLCLYFLTFAGPWPVQSSWSGRFGMQMGWVGIYKLFSCKCWCHKLFGATILRKLQDGKLECRCWWFCNRLDELSQVQKASLLNASRGVKYPVASINGQSNTDNIWVWLLLTGNSKKTSRCTFCALMQETGAFC